jgi:hypothetical protein
LAASAAISAHAIAATAEPLKGSATAMLGIAKHTRAASIRGRIVVP